MNAYQITDIRAKLRNGTEQYLEFLRFPSMSMGLYELGVGSKDLQSPHTEDEIYYVLKGVAIIRVANEDQPVNAGSVVFVAANVEHYFHTITEDLSLLVFFAPAEYTNEAR
jgi:mannose-6-phosphate isomerase-like protein (cupin superfamily)